MLEVVLWRRVARIRGEILIFEILTVDIIRKSI
jgi:hypothetical protein